jgi:hypothetical protein
VYKSETLNLETSNYPYCYPPDLRVPVGHQDHWEKSIFASIGKLLDIGSTTLLEWSSHLMAFQMVSLQRTLQIHHRIG